MTDHAGLIEKLNEACVGHPHAKIPWPHRLLHEARDTIASLVKERDEASTYAKNFLVSFVNRYCDPVEDWAPLPDLIGMLTQLDNASTVAGDLKAQRDAMGAALREILQEVLFGPIANMESEDASLLRGPEPHHRAEGVIEALQRIATALSAVPAPPVQEPVAWGYVGYEGLWVATRVKELADAYAAEGIDVQPLYASPSPLPAQEDGWQPERDK